MTESSSTATQTGTPGIDIFKIAGASIAGYFYSYRTGNGQLVRMPYCSIEEFRLGLYTEYHPHVVHFQRGDVTPEFARVRRHATLLPVPYRIGYVFEGKSHFYLPDYVGTFKDGGLLIAEAGRFTEKQKGQALAKADAARTLAQLKGGAYWISTEQHLSDRRFQNLLFLHVRRDSFRRFDEIAAAIQADWPWGIERSVSEFMRRLGSKWSDEEIEAAVWKIAGDAAASGRLIVDLDEVQLDLSTPLLLLDPDAPPILPPPLPDSLEDVLNVEQSSPPELTDDEESEAAVLPEEGLIPGPTFDSQVLEEEDRKTFDRNYTAVLAVLSGRGLREVAAEHDMAPSSLSYLIKRAKEYGQIALAPHQAYHREAELRPEFREKIRELYKHPMRPSIMAVYEHKDLKDLAEKLTKREGKLVLGPTYRQVSYCIKSFENERSVADARSGLKHPPRPRMSVYSFVLSITAPALICQVDEHFLDILVVALDGTVITRRVHAGVLICVKTGAILGAVLALSSLKEADYMRLIKQTIEKKDKLVQMYECQNPWPCFGKPAVIFHDRGKIFTSERAQQVLVERFHIATEQAPPYAPTAKGTAEALLKWVAEKFAHRLPGTTKATPQERGAYQSVQEAEKAGITLDVLEKYFYQAIVDGYMREWDRLRKQTHFVLWQEAVRQYGVPKWLGSQDDLKLLLMKAENRKNKTGSYLVQSDRISFLGRWYTNPKGLLSQFRNKEVGIRFDERDISVIYLYFEGQYIGDAFCPELMGRRISLWEANAERRALAPLAKAAEGESLENRQQMQKRAMSGKRVQYLESVRLEKQRQLDLQEGEIHTEQVQATIQAFRRLQEGKAVPSAPAISGIAPAEEDEEDTPIRRLVIRPKGSQDGQK